MVMMTSKYVTNATFL